MTFIDKVRCRACGRERSLTCYSDTRRPVVGASEVCVCGERLYPEITHEETLALIHEHTRQFALRAATGVYGRSIRGRARRWLQLLIATSRRTP